MRLRNVHSVGCFFLISSLLSALLVVSPALAGGGSVCDGDWCPDCPPLQVPPGVVLITPAGTGPSLAEQGLEITVEIVSCDPQDPPVLGAGDVELHPPDSNVQFCNPLPASASVDEEGRTTFSGVIAGGGYMQSGSDPLTWSRVTLYGQFVPLYGAIDFVSPDINGDLRVNLADVARFGQDYAGSYHFRSDLSPDGRIDIADVAVLAIHLGEACE